MKIKSETQSATTNLYSKGLMQIHSEILTSSTYFFAYSKLDSLS